MENIKLLLLLKKLKQKTDNLANALGKIVLINRGHKLVKL